MSELPLVQSLSHVATLLERARPSFARTATFTNGGDPLFIDLPVFTGGAAGTVSAQAVQVLGSLYFLAEIEGTYLPSVAEEIANNRFTLNLTDREAAQALETLASRMRQDWVDRSLRNQIFARVFGIGYADPNLGDTAINSEFEPQFARFCMAIAATARDLRGWGAPAGAAARASVAAQSLLRNLAGRAQGNTLIVTEQITDQLRVSIEALNHPGLAALFMGRTAWDVVRGVLGADTPDMQGQVNRGQTGLRLFSWLSSHLDALRELDAQGVMDAVVSEPQLQGWAEVWLDAAGIQVPTEPQRGAFQ